MFLQYQDKEMAMSYLVIKAINGHGYVYRQETYRQGGKVLTKSEYIGPVDPIYNTGNKRAAAAMVHGRIIAKSKITYDSEFAPGFSVRKDGSFEMEGLAGHESIFPGVYSGKVVLSFKQNKEMSPNDFKADDYKLLPATIKYGAARRINDRQVLFMLEGEYGSNTTIAVVQPKYDNSELRVVSYFRTKNMQTINSIKNHYPAIERPDA